MEIQPAAQTDINAVLQQMRTLRAQARLGEASPLGEMDAIRRGENSRGVDFGDTLKNAIDGVNELQQTAGRSADDFVLGKHNDLVRVMVDGQKANIGFQAMLQVRNRMVSAYQDIMNMPI